jgi:hypothetical protein
MAGREAPKFGYAKWPNDCLTITDTIQSMASDQEPKQHLKYFEGQFDDEEVLYVFRRHPLVMRKGLIYGMLCWLIGPVVVLILTYTMPNPPSLVVFFLSMIASIIFGTLFLMPWWISWYFSVFIVPTQRFVQITQKGLFGSGTIVMQTYMGEMEIHDLPHPAKIQRKIVQILRDSGVTPVELGFKRGVPEQQNV